MNALDPTTPFVRRVRVRGFRSLAGCDVTLGPLTVLLGFNASGKSNFLDVRGAITLAVSVSAVVVTLVEDRV
ncbi:hypothetical protein [Micromonospora sp. LOL_023]|uniref:hypothetical protein n=1 Tax=Micromonospora sp. LOL_023 TaxID=3345418 RepID=UPI003A84AB4D